jgi:hypothetical protein
VTPGCAAVQARSQGPSGEALPEAVEAHVLTVFILDLVTRPATLHDCAQINPSAIEGS